MEHPRLVRWKSARCTFLLEMWWNICDETSLGISDGVKLHDTYQRVTWSHIREPSCEWLTSCVIAVLTQWTNICQVLSWFSPCDQVWLPLCVCVSVYVCECVWWVCKWLCTLCKKPQCCIIHQPGERCSSHLISHSSCVLIVSANSCLFRQVRCKCRCSDLHVWQQTTEEKGKSSFIICKLYFAVITL